MIKTGRRYGASCFSIFSADLSGARPRRSDRRYRAFAPWAPLLSVSIPSILCTAAWKMSLFPFFAGLFLFCAQKHVRLSRFRTFFPVRMPSCFCPFFVQFRLIAAKIGKTKFSIGEGVAFFHFHDTITVQILMEVLPMAYQIGSGCVSCGACADVCPVGAISQGDDHYVIDANSCLDCGTCSDTCPNGAISPAE